MVTFEQTIEHNLESREQAALIMSAFECEGFTDTDECLLEGGHTFSYGWKSDTREDFYETGN